MLPSVLRPDWETLARLSSRRNKPLDVDAYPTPTSIHRFYDTIDKLKSAWFWDPKQETVAVILRPISLNQSCQFWGPNRETWATGFEAKPGEIVLVVLRPNHWQTIDLAFEAKPRNSRSSSPCAWYRLHTMSPDLLIVQPPSTRHVLDHPRSSAPGLLLLLRSSSLPAISHLSPTHRETSQCNSPDKQW
jgi:hypothetical protein